MRSRAIALIVGLLLVSGLAVSPVAARDAETPRSAAASVALEHLAAEVGAADVEGATVTDEYQSAHNKVTHVYLRQSHEGLDVLGAEATINVQDGVVVYSGERFIADIAANASGEKQLTAEDALAAAAGSAAAAPGAVRVAPDLVYQAMENGTARLAYNLELAQGVHLWNISVDAEDGDILRKIDLVDHEDIGTVAASTARQEDAHALRSSLTVDPVLPPQRVDDGSSYNVYPLPMESPLDGARSVVANPADATASPFGWHDTDGKPGAEFTITRGNNANAYADTVGARGSAGEQSVDIGGANAADPASQPDGGAGLDFNHPIASLDATPASYRDAAVDNLFFWSNVMHDVTHSYGFDEAAGNFQQTNYSGVGAGNDAVLAEAQDGTYTIGSTSPPALNANFSTPADGAPGRMQMYLWADAFRDLGGDAARVHSTQVRDGDLDSGVIAHEYGHGISNRLVGGPSNVTCLREHDEREGEGWSDWWAYALTMRDGDNGATARGIGNYVVYYDQGRTGPGIRITPYSTDMKVNPSTYSTIKTAAEPHGVGYVWASMLWDLYWNLVEVHGFNENPYESWETGGNNLAIQLVVDGMKMAPCTPGFVDARNAIIAADAALTGDVANGVPGQHECLIWRTFARRGLGFSANQKNPASKIDGVQAFNVPEHCTG